MMISAANFETLYQPLSMSSRELAEVAGITHGEVKRMIKSLETTQRLTQPLSLIDVVYDGETRQEYRLNKHDSLMVIARLSPTFTAAALDRWQQRERAINMPDFTNPAAAARAWAEEFERRQQLEAELSVAAPKADFFDDYVNVSQPLGFRQVCKMLQIKEPEFRQFLLERQIMYRLAGVLTPHKHHLDAGRFELRTGTSENRHTYAQARFSPKGVKWITNLWAVHHAQSKQQVILPRES